MIDVRDFGAVGDGHTDDASSIQAAIDSLALPGGIVHLGVGEFAVRSAPLRLPSNVILAGEGPGVYVYGQHPDSDPPVPCTALVSRPSDNLPWVVEITGPEEERHNWAAGVRDLAIRNQGGGGLLVRNAIEVDLDRVAFISCAGDALRIESSRSYDVHVRSCQFFNNAQWGINIEPGGYVHGPDRVHIFNSYLINNRLGQLRVVDAQNVVLRDSSFVCSIGRQTSDSTMIGIYAWCAHGLVIDGCYSENFPRQAIILEGDERSAEPYWRATLGAVIRNNFMVGMSPYSQSGVIELRRTEGCQITGNLIVAREARVMPIVYFGPGSKRNIVTWNEFYDGGWRPLEGQRYYGGPSRHRNLVWHFHDSMPAALEMTLPAPSHEHPLPDHQHPLPEHEHPLPEHQHPLPEHQHPLPEHQHPLPEHQHPLPEHEHPLPFHTHPMAGEG